MIARPVFVFAVFLTSCGYHVAGRADLVPKTVKTIAVPAFENATIRYKLTDEMAEAVAREFIARTRFRVVPNADTADAVLSGTVLNYTSGATVLEPDTNRAAVVELHIYLRIVLTERASGKVLFTRPNMEVRERYQVAASGAAFDQKNYFEETDTAIRRAATQAASQVVSSILENF